MSGYPPESYPPDPYQPQGHPPGGFQQGPGGYQQGPGGPDPYAPPPQEIRQRVIPPAVGLMVIAVLSFLGGLYFIVNAVVTGNIPDEQFKQQVTMFVQPDQKAQFDDPAFLQKMRTTTFGVCLGLGGVSIFVALILLLGSIGMMSLKWYGLAVFASVLAAIPCISVTACCALGEGIGIWSLVVLLNPEVRSAFR